ncbi:type I restriction enzyme, S subunit [Ruminococcus sp. YRD2003]|uniref:restriction endonuclease subunit S n=1 Tax=Ruminococcus sp. YRD2003 TaxID=1452313 RepID=UPI0008CB75F6|nr:type I restriction enzyme, S subunit [Ruminococcus flavefaciens]
MKDSGIEWIEEIPEKWDIVKLKYYSYMKGRIGWQGLGSSDFIDEGPYCVTGTDFINGKVNWETCYHVSEERYEMDKFIQIQVGDLLITKDGTIGKLAKITELPDKACLNSHLLIIRPLHNRFSNEYLYYVLSSYVFWKYYTIHSSGSIMASLSQEKLKDFSFPVPSLKEQQLLVSYLDRKCAHIDNIIEKTKASVEEYKKLRQAVITQAVTKGVRGDRPMKDSGIEWIGEIPQEWDIISLKYLCNMYAGKNLVSEQIAPEGEYPVYGGNGIRGYYNEYNCEGNNLLVGRQGALCGNVHRVSGKFWATEHAVITTNTTYCIMDYLFYLLIGMNLNQYVSSTAAQPGLSVSTIQNVKTCFVPFEEQQEIAEYLDKKCTEIDSLISKKEQFLTELESYKKSMIYEYVTGKKEVPQA